MADRLTQLQNAIDQLAVQFYSAMHYLDTHHDFVPLDTEAKVSDPQVTVDDPAVFEATKLELARDIMVKTRQIDLLIASLPGAGVSEQAQLARVRKLEQDLVDAEKERQRWLARRNELLDKCDSVILQLAQRKNEIETGSNAG
ncbi:mediator complex, subunit Med21 [Lipomyces tetrasporus]|uniref:Mediator of RNA polymerase II transcription subunit 21 n=1 Tax=Lipomyces tetrasporus TaxID=54092 RepID=A0AAD7VRA3_9ASCO|nr:mediator complex, subunit Med21 [Lipomyces tetrasporus]KAJ8097945.1 mediator complex, subunit Med21 [Lipomyces tetrasporus]